MTKTKYKRLGDYIKKVDNRNKDLRISKLMGLSMTKEFRETTSNIIGTDLSKYRIVSKWQFVCDFMSPIRVNRLPIVLKTDDAPVIVSPAYPVFEVIGSTVLNPEYLMMWFRREEFDRYVTFKCDSAIRGGYGWEELCNTEIPIPSPDKQFEVVSEYNIVQKRIDLNNQLIKKLEETAQAVFKQWFVDNQTDDYEIVRISDFGKIVTGKTPSSECPEDFGDNTFFITPGDFKNYNKFALSAERCLSETGRMKLKNKILPIGSIIVTCIGSDMGKVAVASENCITNQQMNSIIVNESYYSDFLYYYFISTAKEIKGTAMGGSTMPMLSKSDFEKIELIKPTDKVLKNFERVMKPINEITILYSNENKKLLEMQNVLLSMMTTL